MTDYAPESAASVVSARAAHTAQVHGGCARRREVEVDDSADAVQRTGILPLPRQAVFLEGACELSAGFSVHAGPGLENEALLAEKWLSEALGVEPRTGTSGARIDVCLRDGAGDASLGDACSGDADSSDGGTVGAGAYRLAILPGGIKVVARDAAGIFYGIVSLRQLAMSHKDRIPAMLIDDAPRFGWRGFMLDTARNFFSVGFIEKMLDLAAFHKLNIFHWHLVDDQAWRLEVPSHPELTALGASRLDRRFNEPRWKSGSYSPEDVARLVAFAAARHITIMPEIESPGHALALLASHPELACVDPAKVPERPDNSAQAVKAGSPDRECPRTFEPEDRYGVFDDIMCAGNDAVFGLLADVHDYVASVFPGPWVHCGGDEAPKARWKSCPRCKARMDRELLVDGEGERGIRKDSRPGSWADSRRCWVGAASAWSDGTKSWTVASGRTPS